MSLMGFIRVLSFVLVLGFVVLSPAQSERGVQLTGTVYDTANKPVPHAMVEALPLKTQGSQSGVATLGNPWVEADENGSFSLTVAPGRYRIRAKLEAEGYPDPSFWLNRDQQSRFPDVNVGAHAVTGVVVILGSKGGVLSGDVRDERADRPIANAKIRLQDAGNADAYIEIFSDANGKFHYAVPAKPLEISVEAPGYKQILTDHRNKLVVPSGEQRILHLSLEPAAK